MKPEAQRIAIAEACGWKHEKYIDMGQPCKDFWMFNGKCYYLSDLPDYTQDLNAMHEAEKRIPRGDRHEYPFKLSEVVLQRKLTVHDRIEPYIVFATASQKAEAFLKTIGKWTTD